MEETILKMLAGMFADGVVSLWKVVLTLVLCTGVLLKYCLRAVTAQGEVIRRSTEKTVKKKIANRPVTLKQLQKKLRPLVGELWRSLAEYAEDRYSKGYRTVPALQKSNPSPHDLSYILERGYTKAMSEIVEAGSEEIYDTYFEQRLGEKLNNREFRQKDFQDAIDTNASLMTRNLQSDLGKEIVSNKELREAYEGAVTYEKLRIIWEECAIVIWEQERALSIELDEIAKEESFFKKWVSIWRKK